MSVPTVDEEAWRLLEPGTAHPLQRLRAVRELVDAGINAGVLMAPIVPGFSSSRAETRAHREAIADHGARFVGCNVMYLQDGTRSHFMEFLEREFPSMVPALRTALCRRSIRRSPTAKKCRRWCGRCRIGTGLIRRVRRRTARQNVQRRGSVRGGISHAEPEQVGFTLVARQATSP